MKDYTTMSTQRDDAQDIVKGIETALQPHLEKLLAHLAKQEAELVRLHEHNALLVAERNPSQIISVTEMSLGSNYVLVKVDYVKQLELDNQRLRKDCEQYYSVASNAERRAIGALDECARLNNVIDDLQQHLKEREAQLEKLGVPQEPPTSLIERVQEDSASPLQQALQERMRVDAEETLAFATGLG